MAGSSKRVVAITGAAHGIGFATALRMAGPDTDLVLLDRDEAVADSARECAGRSRSALPIAADLTDYASVEKAFAQIRSEVGPVDVLINNVGQAPRERFRPFFDSGPELWEFIVDVCLMTTIACSRQVVNDMRDRKRGRIVSVSSEAAFTGGGGSIEYSAAKGGVLGYTRALARVMAPHGVTVNAVCPGATRTRAADQWTAEVKAFAISGIPMQRMAEPDEIAAAISFLASDDASFITGQSLLVNGGKHMT